jgi:hypothetical protein
MRQTVPDHRAAVSNPAVQQCIEECLNCSRTCLQMSMNDCLERGGRHLEPAHFRLMVNCAEICRTAADFMLTGSPLHAHICAACAEVCQACANSCKEIGDMDGCVKACQRCAETCSQMAGSAIGTEQGQRQSLAASSTINM